MNELRQFFENHKGRLIHKWIHYFEIYERHFERFRGKAPCILEIGVSHGGSLQMWRDYFGPEARIMGVDVDPRCAGFGEGLTEVLIGDQADREFLKSLKAKMPHVDILIDDGGHTAEQQLITFQEMYHHVAEDGVYLCEDLHTSYWSDYGGGYRHPGAFIEFSKTLVDELNAWHSRDSESFKVTSFTENAYSMHFYDSIVVVEKRKMIPPYHEMRGIPSF